MPKEHETGADESAARPPHAVRPHELEIFLQQDLDEMASEYARIYARTTEDPGTAGDEGEENWAHLLRSWLPDSYTVVTKGRILGTDGQSSPQVDLLILKPSYPARLINKKMYLVSGVAAVFECKTTLKRTHLAAAAKTAAAVKQLSALRTGTPYRELTRGPMFGVLAHSHVWKSSGSTPLQNVTAALQEDESKASHPRELLDLVCVADLGSWILIKGPYLGLSNLGDIWTDISQANGIHEDGGASTTYMGKSPEIPGIQRSSIGVAIAVLLQILAWEDVSMRPMAEYFKLAGLWGGGSGQSRYWPLSEVYTQPVAERLLNGDSVPVLEWNDWQQQMP